MLGALQRLTVGTYPAFKYIYMVILEPTSPSMDWLEIQSGLLNACQR